MASPIDAGRGIDQFRRMRSWLVSIAFLLSLAPLRAAYDLDALPETAAGFTSRIIVREPAVMHPGALCFDARGRLFVGGGPQFRKPSPDTPPDSVKLLQDKDGDGVMESVTEFATGLGCVQALAWRGKDLWVANCPDVTILRDHDGDDVADEYIRVYDGLGHLRHGLHGFVFAPDGMLYMSQGNSGVQPHAPKPFRDLMGVKSDAPDTQPQRSFKPADYQRTYIGKWPSLEGGFLRCEADGGGLEIFARGNRNPWDHNIDDGFNWLATDNDDGPEHDRIIMPFQDAHFGKRHAWSYSWTGQGNPCTAPMSGLFPKANGSGVGVVYYSARQFPEPYRGCFLIGDWTDKSVFVFRPKWEGALMTQDGDLERLATAGRSNSLFRPTDIEVGPEGALYVAGWGAQYGSVFAPYQGGDKKAKANEGRIFKIWHEPTGLSDDWNSDKRRRPLADWTVGELMDDLSGPLPVWRVDAQDELVRRGPTVAGELWRRIDGGLPREVETWALWALGRMEGVPDRVFAERALAGDRGLNHRIQCLRILGRRRADVPAAASRDKEPRVRFAAAQALARRDDSVEALFAAAEGETDRLCRYVIFRALANRAGEERLAEGLASEHAGVRAVSFLALAESGRMPEGVAEELVYDADFGVVDAAKLWIEKQGRGVQVGLRIDPPSGEFVAPFDLVLSAPGKGLEVRYTLDHTDPTAESPRFTQPVRIEETAAVKAALFRKGKRIGRIVPAQYRRVTQEEWDRRLRISGLHPPRYAVAADRAEAGVAVYIDREYSLKQLPDDLRGATLLRTANDDSDKKDEAMVRFHLSRKARLVVAHDARTRKKPEWLDGFERRADTLATTDTGFDLFSRDVEAGEVVLGPNGASSMYIVLVQDPGGVTGGQAAGTTVAQTLPLVPRGDVENGERLFFAKGACFACHRIGERGIAVGPDLNDLGSRAEADYVAQSILDPGAQVIEGFMLSKVVLRDGGERVGMVRDEDAGTVAVYGMDGRAELIRAGRIRKRENFDQSPMPAHYPWLFTPQECADLTAWLLTLKPEDASSDRD